MRVDLNNVIQFSLVISLFKTICIKVVSNSFGIIHFNSQAWS